MGLPYKNLISTGALAFLTACGHAPQKQEQIKTDEAANRERLILNANVEKVAVETATHRLLFDTNIMEGYARYGVIYSTSSCAPYINSKAIEFPLELKDAYSKALYKLRYLDALSEKELTEQKKTNEISVETIQRNISVVRSYCQIKFGS